MAFKSLMPGDFVELRAPKNVSRYCADITLPESELHRAGFLSLSSFKSGIVGVVLGDATSAAERQHGFRYWTMVFTYDCRVAWFPSKHLVLRKRSDLVESAQRVAASKTHQTVPDELCQEPPSTFGKTGKQRSVGLQALSLNKRCDNVTERRQ